MVSGDIVPSCRWVMSCMVAPETMLSVTSNCQWALRTTCEMVTALPFAFAPVVGSAAGVHLERRVCYKMKRPRRRDPQCLCKGLRARQVSRRTPTAGFQDRDLTRVSTVCQPIRVVHYRATLGEPRRALSTAILGKGASECLGDLGFRKDLCSQLALIVEPITDRNKRCPRDGDVSGGHPRSSRWQPTLRWRYLRSRREGG